MPYTQQNGHYETLEAYSAEAFAETPFADPAVHEQEDPQHELSIGEMLLENLEFNTPFLPGESSEAGEAQATSPEVAEFNEMLTELKDARFLESLEQLADEALEAHSSQIAAEYGDRETRDLTAERMLMEHFE